MTRSACWTKLRSSRPICAARCFPDWETLPYDTFSPHQDLISERLATLWRISQRDKDNGADVIIVPATTALYRLAPPSFLAGYTFEFKVKQKLDEAKLKAQLTLAGYSHVTQVVSPGEYAVRGGLIDLFPMGSAVPFRVDLFDDEIDSIRTFDPDSQRSLYPVPEVRCCRGANSRWTTMRAPNSAAAGANCWRATRPKSRIYKDIGNGVATAGIEYYLPLFFDETATVFDYLGARTPPWCCMATWSRLPALLARHQGPLPPGAGRPRAPGAAAESCSSAPSSSMPAPMNTPNWRSRPADRRRFCPTSKRCLPYELDAQRGTEDPLLKLKGPSAQHAAAHVGAGRK